MSAVLRVENLTVAFAGRPAVNGLDLSLAPGETLALVGESGCGKSVTALSLMGLLPPGAKIVSGRVLLDDEDILALPARRLRDLRGKKIAMIFQEPMTSLNPVMTIGDQIEEVLHRHESLSRRARRARVVDLVDLVGIPDAARRIHDYPHNLSGGMRQRVMIAMAVACNPEVLVADEPTTALDVTIQAQVLELVDELRRRLGMALVLITHDLGVVARRADRVAVMYAGRLAEEATAERLFTDPRHPYTRGLLETIAPLTGGDRYDTTRLAEIPGSIASAAREPGCAFAPRCSEVEPECRLGPAALTPIGEGHRVACRRVAPRGGL